jgi:hypothetical protein
MFYPVIFITRFLIILILASTFLVCMIKWKKTKDVGFLFLCLCLVILPTMGASFDFYLNKAAVSALQTGSGSFIFLKMTWNSNTGQVANGTFNPENVLQFLDSAKSIGTELVKFIIVLVVCRMTISGSGKSGENTKDQVTIDHSTPMPQ